VTEPRAAEHAEPQPPSGGEEAAIRCIVEQFCAKHHADNLGRLPALRCEHAKSHACVHAKFVVLDGLEPELRQGIFACPRAYDAWIRFSASAAPPRSDVKRDLQGIALKLIDVPDGNGSLTTQDFVLSNHPVFPVRDAADYCALSKVLIAPSRHARDVGALLAHIDRYARDLLMGFQIKLLKPGISNPLTTRYWSQTPYKLGERDHVKYSVRPRPRASIASRPVGSARRVRAVLSRDPSRYDFLQEAMARQLSGQRGDAGFDFQVQLRTDPETMPIEDPRVRWDERASPFRTVARIEIPAQEFRSQSRRNFAENLSFTPSRALPAHAPLGAINRVRAVVYDDISKLRHEINGVPRREPTATQRDAGGELAAPWSVEAHSAD
jgi:hypothetical protein